MFTGIVETIGEVCGNRDGRLEVLVSGAFGKGIKTGSSIAINGACLSVVKCKLSNGKCFLCFDVVQETLRCTNLGLLKKGDTVVNLERALKAGGRFEGHIVQGHVDATGRITNYRTEDRIFTIQLSKVGLMRYIVPKGSITIDGISLTVVDVGRNYFTVAIIPHTWENTIVRFYKKGTVVNIETDILAKYVERVIRKT
jgi:riboflavin synthase